jgi:membrane-associated phospholipid phosphatase
MNKLLLFLIAFLSLATGLLAQVEPKAGNWKTWVISSVHNYRLPPPPDKKATRAELKELLNIQSKQDAQAIEQVHYWNAGSPGYRWQELASKLSKGNIPPFRTLALLHAAIYDATVAAWDNMYFYNRPRPTTVINQVRSYIPTPASPSYPCEHAVAAGAATGILSYLFPQQADSLHKLALQAAESRIVAGVQYPSDVKAGLELGRKVAQQVIEKAKTDGSAEPWKGSTPTQVGLWSGTNPVGASWGSWKPWVLDSANQFRPAPPPDFGRDMEELRQFKPTPQSAARYYQYAFVDTWSNITNQKLFEYNLVTNPPRAARVYALKSIAFYDAILACWEAKYFYWGIRPYQYDTTFTKVLGRPPFPGYPSGHATTSSAVATVVTYLFPAEKAYFQQVAQECAESRFEGGLHFRTDNEVGLELGRKVGQAVVQRAKLDSADGPPRLVKK